MGLRLFFLPNFPGATFIQGVRLFQTLEYITWANQVAVCQARPMENIFYLL